MSLPARYSVAPATEGDVDEMAALANAYDVVDLGEPDTAVEHLLDSWHEPTFTAEHDSWLVRSADGRLAAFGLIERRRTSTNAFGRVHPDHRGRGLGAFLVDAMEARARAVGGRSVFRVEVTSTDAEARALLERRGFGLVRLFWHMERDLGSLALEPVSVPVGTRIRAVQTGEEREAWAALEEAFRHHWAFEPEPFDEWMAITRSAGETIGLALADDEVVGAVTLRPASDAGWVDELGVRRPWRGRGIGEALLRYAFGELASDGACVVRLNVDAENRTGATRLYERAGMHVRREWLVYERRLWSDRLPAPSDGPTGPDDGRTAPGDG